LGRRVKKSWSYQDNGQTRSVSYSYVYGAKGEILIEYKRDSTPSTVYEDSRARNIYMGSALVAGASEGTRNGLAFSTTSWPRRNHRQEEIYTVSISSGQVQISDNLYSKAFGSAGSDQFPGQKADDETGLKDFGARYYNTLLMRWTSTDPVTAHIYDPQSLNKYVYVRNDPVNLVDQDGNFWKWITKAGEFILKVITDGQEAPDFDNNLIGLGEQSHQKKNKKPAYYEQNPCDEKDPTNKRAFEFIRKNFDAANLLAKQLDVPVSWVLGVSAAETTYGAPYPLTRNLLPITSRPGLSVSKIHTESHPENASTSN
jgi:RHS repeat-associated protein